MLKIKNHTGARIARSAVIIIRSIDSNSTSSDTITNKTMNETIAVIIIPAIIRIIKPV